MRDHGARSRCLTARRTRLSEAIARCGPRGAACGTSLARCTARRRRARPAGTVDTAGLGSLALARGAADRSRDGSVDRARTHTLDPDRSLATSTDHEHPAGSGGACAAAARAARASPTRGTRPRVRPRARGVRERPRRGRQTPAHRSVDDGRRLPAPHRRSRGLHGG